MIRFLTAGESHGQALVAVVDGIPAGLPIDAGDLARDLWRRQQGFGRGRRMAIEQDQAEILSGVRGGVTIGGPITLIIRNKDWENWQKTMAVTAEPPPDATGANRQPVTRPRPGHADLAGSVKYDRRDIRDVLERASARETAARVAAGGVARLLLQRFGIEVVSHVVAIGPVAIAEPWKVTFDQVRAIPDDTPLRCVDPDVEAQMVAAIEQARADGDTLGGTFEVIARPIPVGLGSYVQWDRKLDGRMAQAIMSIPAIKGVGIGRGAEAASLPGSAMHDEIVLADGPTHPGAVPGLARPTNNAGGLEGGVTNGEELRVTGHMKPISTLMKPLRSVDLRTMEPSPAAVERSDVCAVLAAGVVGEAMTCLILADALVEKLGGDSLGEMEERFKAFTASLSSRFASSSAR